jgi:hypothetical protein
VIFYYLLQGFSISKEKRTMLLSSISHGRLGRYSPKCSQRGCSSKVTGSSPDITVMAFFPRADGALP